jgi:hypothetical protein
MVTTSWLNDAGRCGFWSNAADADALRAAIAELDAGECVEADLIRRMKLRWSRRAREKAS